MMRVQRGVQPPQRLVAAEDRERLEDARRDRRARQRDADRLEDVLGLAGGVGLDDLAQRYFDALDVERLEVRERLAGLDQPMAVVVVEPLLARRGVVARP